MATLRQWQERPNAQADGGVGRLVAFRLFVGALQGAALYGLEEGARAKLQLFSDPFFVVALYLTLLLIPSLVVISAGTIRSRTLALWTVAAALSTTALGYYAGWRGGLELLEYDFVDQGLTMVAAGGGTLLLINAVLAGAAGAGRRFPRYPDFFAALAKQVIEIVIALLFVGAALIVLRTCGELFRSVGIETVGKTLEKQWVVSPFTTLAFALGVHVIDRRPSLVAGIRTLALTLLGALLPVMTIVALGFLGALPFTGLDPLWDTGNATPIVLFAALVLAVLINAVYQDGAAERAPHAVVKAIALVASLAMVALVAIAAYSVWLRVTQYGWSVARIVAAACIAVAAWVSVGYSASLVVRRRWLKTLEPTNFGAVGIGVVLLIAMFSPIADPARLAVLDQMGRAAKDGIDLATVDLKFLRFDTARFGQAVLDKLATSPNKVLAKQVVAVKAMNNRYQNLPLDPETIKSNITVYPEGAVLPDDFFGQDFQDTFYFDLPECMRQVSACDARMVNLDDDKANEILIWSDDDSRIFVFDRAGTVWTRAGWAWVGSCAGRVADNLRTAPPKVIAPQWKDLELLGQRVNFGRSGNFEPDKACPEEAGSNAPNGHSVVINVTRAKGAP